MCFALAYVNEELLNLFEKRKLNLWTLELSFGYARSEMRVRAIKAEAPI